MTITNTLPKSTEHSSAASLTLDLLDLTNTWNLVNTTDTPSKDGGFVRTAEYVCVSGVTSSSMSVIARVQQDFSNVSKPGVTRMSVRLVQSMNEVDDVALSDETEDFEVVLALNMPTHFQIAASKISTAVQELLRIIYPDASTSTWGTPSMEIMQHGSPLILE